MAKNYKEWVKITEDTFVLETKRGCLVQVVEWSHGEQHWEGPSAPSISVCWCPGLTLADFEVSE